MEKKVIFSYLIVHFLIIVKYNFDYLAAEFGP